MKDVTIVPEICFLEFSIVFWSFSSSKSACFDSLLFGILLFDITDIVPNAVIPTRGFTAWIAVPSKPNPPATTDPNRAAEEVPNAIAILFKASAFGVRDPLKYLETADSVKPVILAISFWDKFFSLAAFLMFFEISLLIKLLQLTSVMFKIAKCQVYIKTKLTKCQEL